MWFHHGVHRGVHVKLVRGVQTAREQMFREESCSVTPPTSWLRHTPTPDFWMPMDSPAMINGLNEQLPLFPRRKNIFLPREYVCQKGLLVICSEHGH